MALLGTGSVVRGGGLKVVVTIVQIYKLRKGGAVSCSSFLLKELKLKGPSTAIQLTQDLGTALVKIRTDVWE